MKYTSVLIFLDIESPGKVFTPLPNRHYSKLATAKLKIGYLNSLNKHILEVISVSVCMHGTESVIYCASS